MARQLRLVPQYSNCKEGQDKMKNRLKYKALLGIVVCLLTVTMMMPMTAQAKVFPYSTQLEVVPGYQSPGTDYTPPQWVPGVSVGYSPFYVNTSSTTAQLIPNYGQRFSRVSGGVTIPATINNIPGVIGYGCPYADIEGMSISYKFFANEQPFNIINIGKAPVLTGVWIPEVKGYIGWPPVEVVVTPGYWEWKYSSYEYSTGQLITGLQPNKDYIIYVDQVSVNGTISRWCNYGDFPQYFYWQPSETTGKFTRLVESNVTFYTDSVAPTSPTYTNIKATSLTVNWTKGENYHTPQYKVYQRIKKAVPDPWTLVYQGTAETVDLTNLEPETTYEYYVNATGINGVSLNSSITTVTTSADPAVAAAQAAQFAAEKAMLESIETRTMTSEIKTEVQKIKEMLNKGQKDEIKPEIEVFEHAISKATITRQAIAPFALVATDNRPGILQYRYKLNNGEYSEWADLTSETVNIELGSAGLKRITAQVKDQAGNIATKTATIFKM